MLLTYFLNDFEMEARFSAPVQTGPGAHPGPVWTGAENLPNNGSEREAGYYRHHREEKAPVVWPR